jgi:DNA repair protein RadC
MMRAWEGYGVYVVREPQFPFPKPSVSTPAEAGALLLRRLAWEDREVFCTVILDARHHVLGINTVSVGSVSASLVHPRETFKPALLMGASAIILAHCHPSGDPTPSQEDIELTRRLQKAGEILGIEVLDHLIIADGQFLSLKERGLL